MILKKNVESNKQSQHRWDSKGEVNIRDIESNPEKYIICKKMIDKRKNDIINAIPVIKNNWILEFGSGRGELSVLLAKHGGIVTGIDIGENLIEFSNKLASVNKVKCKFLIGSIDKLPFDDNVYNYVVGNAILHHLPINDLKKSLEEAYRVLRPGGMAIFIEPIENSKVFDLLQNLIPVGNQNDFNYRPSVIQTAKWKEYLAKVDDRALTDKELMNAKGSFEKVEFIRYYEILSRLNRLYTNKSIKKMFIAIDDIITKKQSPLKKLSRSVLVVYKK